MGGSGWVSGWIIQEVAGGSPPALPRSCVSRVSLGQSPRDRKVPPTASHPVTGGLW